MLGATIYMVSKSLFFDNPSRYIDLEKYPQGDLTLLKFKILIAVTHSLKKILCRFLSTTTNKENFPKG